VLDDLIAINALRQPVVRRLLQKRDVADARHAPLGAMRAALVDHDRTVAEVLHYREGERAQ
jgi:hypothetical protein